MRKVKCPEVAGASLLLQVLMQFRTRGTNAKPQFIFSYINTAIPN